MNKLQEILPRFVTAMKKYRYALLVIFLGCTILLWPNSSKEQDIHSEQEIYASNDYETYGKEVEARLEQVLSSIQGVGQVQVVLTMKQGSTTHYLCDSEVNRESTADKLSEKEEHVHPHVVAHWKSIVDGQIPFGYTIEGE